MIRGSYLSKKDLDNQQIFPFQSVDKEKIKDGYVKKFIKDNFSEYHLIDKITGYVVEGIHEQYPIVHRYRMKLYMTTEIHYYDKLFIDRDRILFMNSETGAIRRVQPSKIQMVLFEEVQKIGLTNL